MEPEMTKKSLIVVGLGWLGGAVARTCRAKGMTVTGTIRDEQRRDREGLDGITAYPYTLGQTLPETLFAGASPRAALIAIPPSTSGLGPEAFEDAQGRLAGELAEGGASPLVFASATSVYAGAGPNPSESDAVDRPSKRSGISLLRVERAVSAGAGETPVVTIRFGGLFGPGREPGRFFQKRVLRFPNDPVNVIHLDDCVRIVSLAMGLHHTTAVNAVAPVHPTKREFYEAAARALSLPMPKVAGPDRSDHPKRVRVDRLVDELGYRFVHPNPLKCVSVT